MATGKRAPEGVEVIPRWPVDWRGYPRRNGRAWRGCPRRNGRAFTQKRSRPYLDPVFPYISSTNRRSGANRGQPCGLTTASTASTTCPCPFGAPPTGGLLSDL